MSFHVMAIDPGGNCGFAVLDGEPAVSNIRAYITALGPWPEKGKGDPPKDAVLSDVQSFCVSHPDGVVIVERFHTAQRGNRYSHFTVELIGAIEGVCYAHDARLHLVINKQRRRFVPVAEQILGIPHNPVPHHDRDDVAALAHLLTYLNRVGIELIKERPHA